MAGFESFFGLDQADGTMSAEALEAFREQMRQNAAHIAAAKRDEQKQRKKEDKLVSVLLKFIQSGKNSHIVNLIAALLAENMPASLIVSILSLNFPELQREIDINLALPGRPSHTENSRLIAAEQNDDNSEKRLMVMDFINLGGLSFEIRIALDLWFQAIKEAMYNYPQKVLNTVVDPLIEDQIRPKICVVQLAAVILRDFLEKKADLPQTERLREFMLEIFTKLLRQVDNDLRERKLLK